MLALALLACGGPSDGSDTDLPGTGDTATSATTNTFECGSTECDAHGCWTAFCGGTFDMGAPDGAGDDDEHPRREVRVSPFQIMVSEVTEAAHDRCVAEGACADPELQPDVSSFCLDRAPESPRGCLDWNAAETFCAWAGARLPSEAEWEYAARSGGLDRKYPWGDAPPTCALAMVGYVGSPCDDDGPAEVCTHPDGNTPEGLCDMAGNIYEWVADWYHRTYDGAPDRSVAWVDPPGEHRVLRGGGTNSDEPMTTTNRTYHPETFYYSGSGVRCARSGRPAAE